jgi:uncharacterized RDD family membrane protein YckC
MLCISAVPRARVYGRSLIRPRLAASDSCLWIVRDEERQSWHDQIAGTYVVSVPRNWPIG